MVLTIKNSLISMVTRSRPLMRTSKSCSPEKESNEREDESETPRLHGEVKSGILAAEREYRV